MTRAKQKEDKRFVTFEELNNRRRTGRLSAEDAAEILGVSTRAFRRWRARYKDEGEEGLYDRHPARPLSSGCNTLPCRCIPSPCPPWGAGARGKNRPACGKFVGADHVQPLEIADNPVAGLVEVRDECVHGRLMLNSVPRGTMPVRGIRDHFRYVSMCNLDAVRIVSIC